jgi:cell shape-determining protein MreD
LVIGSAMLLAVLLQVTLLSRLGLPGATPDLIVVTIVAIGLAMGSIAGGSAGLVGAVLLGLATPAPGLLGVQALVFVVIGFSVGRVLDPRDRSRWILIGIAGLAAAAAVLASAALAALLGSERVAWDAVPALALTSALYGVVLAAVVVPAMGWLSRALVSELAV